MAALSLSVFALPRFFVFETDAVADEIATLAAAFALASPSHIGGPTFAEHHENMRRCYAFRAWCAVRLAHLTRDQRHIGTSKATWGRGWNYEARLAIGAARVHRKLAAAAREVGR